MLCVLKKLGYFLNLIYLILEFFYSNYERKLFYLLLYNIDNL